MHDPRLTGHEVAGHSGRSRRSVLGLLAAAPLAAGLTVPLSGTAVAQTRDRLGSRAVTNQDAAELERRILELLDKPEFNGSWGLAFASAETGEPICAVNAGEPLRLASAIKQFIAATAFENLGPDRTFPTRVYATGPIRHGVLHGDLVLVAGGDLLLGSRVQPDGSIFLHHPDHCYAASKMEDSLPIPGDPLTSLRTLADQIAASGIRRITGNVRVDTSLFRQAPEGTGGMPITVSPLVINDNIVDILITPGRHPGDRARLQTSPHTPYLRIVNKLRTVAPDEVPPQQSVRIDNDVTRPDGTHTITLTGDVPAGVDSLLFPYFMPDPGRFGEIAMAGVLRDKDIHATPPPFPGERGKPGEGNTLIAELETVPLAQQIWPMTKVSSNPHAAILPHLVGAIARDEPDNPRQAFDQLRGDLFAQAGLDPFPPGSEDERYSADFFVTFLNHIHHKPYNEPYVAALGQTGQNEDHPAAGHVYTKDGGGSGPTGDDQMELHYTNAGYIKPPGKPTVSFAILTAHTASMTDIPAQQKLKELMPATTWEIITTVYDALP